MALLYSLLGDSNIRRYVNKNSCRANPALQAEQVIACGHLGIFSESLSSVRAESTGCILSCLTNFISSADGPESVSQRVEPVLHDIRDSIFAACEANPSRSYFVSPPMYRTHPVWYREGPSGGSNSFLKHPFKPPRESSHPAKLPDSRV